MVKTKKDANDAFNKYVRELKAADSATIGMAKGNLYRFLSGHGTASRPAARGGKRKASGLYRFFTQMQNIFKGEADLTNQQLKLIRETIRKLKGVGDNSINNPRNIPFTYPTGEDGSGRAIQYGHPNSKEYIQGMKNKKKARGETYEVPSYMNNIPDAWTSQTLGTARNPLWQAFFVGENESFKGKIISIGLLPLLEKIEKGLAGESVALTIPARTLQKDSTLEQLVDIKSVRKRLNEIMRTNSLWSKTKSTDKEDKEINVVRIKFTDMNRRLTGLPYKVTPEELNTVKTLSGNKDAAGGVSEFNLLSMTANQIEKLLLAAFGSDAKVGGVPVQWFNLWKTSPRMAETRDLQKMHWRDYLQVR